MRERRVYDEIGQFATIPVSVLRNPNLSPNAFRLYAVLRSFTSSAENGNIAFPGYETLLRMCGFGSNRYVVRAIHELEALGLIVRQHRFGKTTIYRLLNPDAASSTTVGSNEDAHSSTNGGRDSSTTVGRISSTNGGRGSRRSNLDVVELDVVAGTHAPARDATPAPSTPSQPKTPTPSGPPPARKTRIRGTAVVIEQSDDPRVEAWLRILGRPTITQTDAEIITRRVRIDSLDAWREALTAWASNPSRRLDMANIIDRYERIVHAATVRGRTATAPSTPEADWHASASAEALRILRERAAAGVPA